MRVMKSILIWGFFSSVLATPGVTENKVVFGQSAAFKGSSAALGSELYRGAKAYFDHINSIGGVNGRKVEILPLDDGYEGQKTLINTINLIKTKKVFNLFGYVGTPTIVKALPAIQKFSKEGVTLFSNFTGAQPQREEPHKEYVFNIRSSYRQETAQIVDNLLKIGHKKIGVFIQYDAYGRSGADGVARGLKKSDLKIVSEVTYKRGAKYSDSMKGQVDKILSDGVSAVVSIGSYAACAAFIRDARMSGFKGPIANVSFVGAESLLNLLEGDENNKKYNLTSKLINSQVVPIWDDTSYPIVKEYKTLMDKFDPQVPSELKSKNYKPSKYSFVSLEGFLNAKVLVEALKRSPKNLTRESFIKTIHQMNDFDVGLKFNLKFAKTRHQASDKVFFTTVKNGRYVNLEKWEDFR